MASPAAIGSAAKATAAAERVMAGSGMSSSGNTAAAGMVRRGSIIQGRTQPVRHVWNIIGEVWLTTPLDFPGAQASGDGCTPGAAHGGRGLVGICVAPHSAGHPGAHESEPHSRAWHESRRAVPHSGLRSTALRLAPQGNSQSEHPGRERSHLDLRRPPLTWTPQGRSKQAAVARMAAPMEG